MKKSALLAGVASAAILVAGSASAFGDNPYFAASGGFNLLGPITVDPVYNSYDNRIFDFSAGVAGSLAIGHHFSDLFRGEAELSYRYNGLQAATVHNEGPQTFNSGSAKSFGVMANGWFDIPTGGVIRPYVGGGIGVAHVRLQADTNEVVSPDYRFGIDADGSAWVFAYQLGAGAAVPLGNSGAELTFDYRYFHAGGMTVQLSDGGGPTGTTTDYSSHSGMIGIRMPIGNLFNLVP